MNKIFITITLSLLISLNAYSKECDDETKARMIKAGISDKVIEEQCNIKIEGDNNEENEEDSENVITNKENDIYKSRPYQIQFILTSRYGNGISLNYNYEHKLWFGFDSQSKSDQSTYYSNSNLTRYERKYTHNTSYLYARYFMFEKMPSFFFQGGLVSRSWELTEQSYRVSDNQKKIKYVTKYPNNALNFGFGWNWISNESGLSGGIYFVTIIGGEPKHYYTSDTGWICNDSCKAEYEESTKVQDPVGMINIGYNFNL